MEGNGRSREGFSGVGVASSKTDPREVEDNLLSDKLAAEMAMLARTKKPAPRRAQRIQLPYIPIRHDAVMLDTVRLMRAKFDDELAQVGPGFLQAEYVGMDNERVIKKAGDFDNGLEDRLRKVLADREILLDTFRVLHPNFCVDNAETGNNMYPFFDFNVEMSFHAGPTYDHGFRMTVGCSTYVDYDQDSLREIFRYAGHYEVMKQVVRDVLGACNRGIEQDSLVDKLLNSIAPFRIAEPTMHVVAPSDRLGVLAYDLSVGLDISEAAVKLSFADNTGFIHTALNKISDEEKARLLEMYVSDDERGMSDLARQSSHGFVVAEDRLGTSSKSEDDHRYVTKLVRNY